MSIAPSPWELAAQQFERTAAEFGSPLDMAAAFDPKLVRTPALDLINDTLVRVFNTPDSRLIVSMPPQEGKSQAISRRFPLWGLTQNPDLRIAVASYEANIARRWGRSVRDDITHHQDRLGLRVRQDLSAQNEWQLEGSDGGMFTAGVGGAMTGRAVDLMVIDDPVKNREQADSPTYRNRAWEWYTDTVETRLSPGASVVIVLTRWHEDDLAGRLIKEHPGVWEVLNIPAQAVTDDDPLNRQPGEFMVSARGRTQKQWEARKQAVGPKTWAALFQGNPTPDEGGVFPSEWPTYDKPLWFEKPNGERIITQLHNGQHHHELLMSWDLTFTGSKTSDYVVGQVWFREDAHVYLLDQFRKRIDFNGTLEAIREMKARWPQAGAVLIEAAANGHAAINMLQSSVPGIVPVTPRGSKEARADAVSPFIHAKNVWLPSADLVPNITQLREEALNFPHGANDDAVDAMTQALNQLFIHPVGANTGGYVEDLYGGFHISDY